MKELRDSFDNDVNVGDTIFYFVKGSTDVLLRFARIKVVMKDEWGYSLRVRSVARSWKGEYRTYRTVLTERNFIKVDARTLPKVIQDLLNRV